MGCMVEQIGHIQFLKKIKFKCIRLIPWMLVLHKKYN